MSSMTLQPADCLRQKATATSPPPPSRRVFRSLDRGQDFVQVGPLVHQLQGPLLQALKVAGRISQRGEGGPAYGFPRPVGQGVAAALPKAA